MTIALGDTALAAGPLPGAGFVLGYGTNGFTDHPLDAALRVLEYERATARWRSRSGIRTSTRSPRTPTSGPRSCGNASTSSAGGSWSRPAPATCSTRTPSTAPPSSTSTRHRGCASCAAPSTSRRSFAPTASRSGRGSSPEGVAPEEGWRRLVARMREIVAYAEASGVVLGFEPEPGMLVETVADALRLREELGSPDALGITVDLGHCVVVEPGGVVGALRAAGDLLVNVQVDDMIARRARAPRARSWSARPRRRTGDAPGARLPRRRGRRAAAARARRPGRRVAEHAGHPRRLEGTMTNQWTITPSAR